jgi:DNA-binding HxlR family transcriptional regulator
MKHGAGCPLSPIVGLFGGRWKPEILWHLKGEALRFNELKRRITGVSQKMLAQQLRALERDGLVHRAHFPEIPPRVEYSLTPVGASLEPVFQQLGAWGGDHLDQVAAARVAYDEAGSVSSQGPAV